MPKNPPTGFAAYPRLGDCAKANMLIVCRCRRCQKSVTYLAADLLEHFTWLDERSPSRFYVALTGLRIVGELWRRCPRCGASGEQWSERERYASSADVGNLLIRRPAGFKQVPLWRDEWYEPPAKSPATHQ